MEAKQEMSHQLQPHTASLLSIINKSIFILMAQIDRSPFGIWRTIRAGFYMEPEKVKDGLREDVEAIQARLDMIRKTVRSVDEISTAMHQSRAASQYLHEALPLFLDKYFMQRDKAGYTEMGRNIEGNPSDLFSRGKKVIGVD